MMTRAQMRRQLRAQGGIMNVAPREKFGIGSTFQKYKDKAVDRARKIIPNELADIAVKAAPLVAMIPGGAPYAAAMRGLGRLDQRGDLMDALKQGALTYGFGEYVAPSIREGLGGLKDRASNFFQGGEKPLTRGDPNFTGGNANTGNIIGGGTSPTHIPGVDDRSLIQKGTDYLSDKVPGFGKLDQIVQEKLLVGGITAAGSYLYEKFIEGYPDPEPGEDMEKYLAERKQRVGAQMRTYMDNYFANDPEYMKLDDAGRNEFVSRYNVRDGGRIGYQAGGVSMDNTLQQNIATNRAQATGIQSMLNAARKKAGLPTVQTAARRTPQPIAQPQTMVPMGPITISRMEEEPKTPSMEQISSAMLSPMKETLGIGSSGGMSLMPKVIEQMQGVVKKPQPQLMDPRGPTPEMLDAMEDGTFEEKFMGPPQSQPGFIGGRPGSAIPVPELRPGNIVSLRDRNEPYQPGIGGESLDKSGNPVDPLLGLMDRPIADFDQPAREDALYNVQSGSGKFTDLKRTRDPVMDPNFMNLSPQEQDAAIDKHIKSMEAFDKRFGSFADGRMIDPNQGRSSYRDILNAIQTDYPEAFKQLKGDETLAELDNLGLKLGGYDTFDLNKTSKNLKDEFGNLIDMSIVSDPRDVPQKPITESPFPGTGAYTPPAVENRPITNLPGAGAATNLPGSGAPGTDSKNLMSGFDKFFKDSGAMNRPMTADVRSYKLPDGKVVRGNSTMKGLMDQYLKSIGLSPTTDVNQSLATGGRVGLMGGSMPMGIMRTNQAGVMERDYRNKGGFVPVGVKEKADDVPAMLSKNEFVMTADAVRGAGGGSIDKGAQKMYNTMKSLERRVR